MRIDYPARRLHLETPLASLEPEDAVWCGPLEFLEGDIMPLLRDFEVDDIALPVSVDTGSNLCLELYPDGARKAHVEPREGATAALFGARGVASARLGTARTIRLGDLVVDDPEIVLATRQRPGNRVGNLGNGFLKHFELELDYVDHHLILRETDALKPLTRELVESEVLARWADALGGHERLAAIRSCYARRTATLLGVEGTIETWMTPTGGHRLEQHFDGLLDSVIVFDGKRGAETSSGERAGLAADQVANSRTRSYVDTWSFVLAGRVPGTARYLGTDPDDGAHIVECRPRGGHIVHFHLNSVTFLPHASEILAGSRRQRTEYTEWATLEGIRFPQLLTTAGPDGAPVESRVAELRFDQDLDDALYR